MPGEVIAAIITAIITAIGTVVAARFDDITELLRIRSRQIAGNWQGESYLIDNVFIDDKEYEQNITADLKYLVTLKQTGSRVRGEMTITETRLNFPPYKHVYKGHVKGSYFVYECFTPKPEEFRLSAALLHIDNSGKLMKGYFVANARSRELRRTLVGYAVMHKLD